MIDFRAECPPENNPESENNPVPPTQPPEAPSAVATTPTPEPFPATDGPTTREPVTADMNELLATLFDQVTPDIFNNPSPHPVPKWMLVNGSAHDKGRRARMEDSSGIFSLTRVAGEASAAAVNFIGVFDGVSSQAGGQMASSTGLRHLLRSMFSALQHLGPFVFTFDAMTALVWFALMAAHQAVRWAISINPQLAQADTTALAILIVDDMALIGWAGDSPAILVRNGEAHQVTPCHTAGNHVITRSLVHPDGFVPEFVALQLQHNDVLLAVTDGVTDVLDLVDLARLVGEHEDPFKLAQAIVTASLAAGSADNVTVTCTKVYQTSQVLGGES